MRGIKGKNNDGIKLAASFLPKDGDNFLQITVTDSKTLGERVNPGSKPGKVDMETKPYTIAFRDSFNFLSTLPGLDEGLYRSP